MSASSLTAAPAAGPVDVDALPLVEITGGKGRLDLAALRELARYRQVLAAFAVRAIKVRYKQAVLGLGWAILQPIVAALIFSLFLGRLAHVQSEGAPYLVFAMSGTVIWSFFSGGVGNAMESVVSDSGLLKKVYFPREIFPFSAILAALVDLSAALLTAIVFALAYGVHPHLSWLAIPIPLLLVLLTAAGAGTVLSAINVFYRDARYVLPFLLQLGLFATPVVYSLSIVPSRWRLLYVALNPVAAGIDAFRRVLLHGAMPAVGTTLVGYACALLLLVAGYWFFKRLERSFSDRI